MAKVTWKGWRDHPTEKLPEAYEFLTGYIPILLLPPLLSRRRLCSQLQTIKINFPSVIDLKYKSPRQLLLIHQRHLQSHIENKIPFALQCTHQELIVDLEGCLTTQN